MDTRLTEAFPLLPTHLPVSQDLLYLREKVGRFSNYFINYFNNNYFINLYSYESTRDLIVNSPFAGDRTGDRASFLSDV